MSPSPNQPRQSLPQDFLKRLGLSRDCSVEDVREAYLRKAHVTHPDHGGDKNAFQQLKQDYEEALRYASSRKGTSAQPHDRTIHVRSVPKPTEKYSWFVKLLVVMAGVALAGCAFLTTRSGFLVSLLTLAATTALLARLALPMLTRAYATVLLLALVLLASMFMIGMWVQGEYSEVYRTPHNEKDVYDWLLAASPAYFIVLGWFGLMGWSSSREP